MLGGFPVFAHDPFLVTHFGVTRLEGSSKWQNTTNPLRSGSEAYPARKRGAARKRAAPAGQGPAKGGDGWGGGGSRLGRVALV